MEPDFHNFTIKLQIDTIDIKNITYSESAIGPQDTEKILEALNFWFYIGIPIINTVLDDMEIHIPHNFNDTLIIEEAAFAANENYLDITMAPILNGTNLLKFVY